MIWAIYFHTDIVDCKKHVDLNGRMLASNWLRREPAEYRLEEQESVVMVQAKDSVTKQLKTAGRLHPNVASSIMTIYQTWNAYPNHMLIIPSPDEGIYKLGDNDDHIGYPGCFNCEVALATDKKEFFNGPRGGGTSLHDKHMVGFQMYLVFEQLYKEVEDGKDKGNYYRCDFRDLIVVRSVEVWDCNQETELFAKDLTTGDHLATSVEILTEKVYAKDYKRDNMEADGNMDAKPPAKKAAKKTTKKSGKK